jgi:RecA-family ATPase
MKPETLADALSWQRPHEIPIISDGFLPSQGGTCVLYGEEGTWKTWLGLDLVWKLAGGEPWFFGLTTQSVPTLVLNTEIPKGHFQDRLQKMVTTRGKAPTNTWFVTDLDRKIDTLYGLNETISEIKDCGAQLLVLDDLYMAASGDLTKPQDWKRVQDGLNRMRSETGCSFFIIHHARQPLTDMRGQSITQGTSEMFGMSYLKNWFNTMMEVRKDGNDSTLKISAQKHRLMSYKPPDMTLQIRRSDITFWLQ